jgi:hypothetical protein
MMEERPGVCHTRGGRGIFFLCLAEMGADGRWDWDLLSGMGDINLQETKTERGGVD